MQIYTKDGSRGVHPASPLPREALFPKEKPPKWSPLTSAMSAPQKAPFRVQSRPRVPRQLSPTASHICVPPLGGEPADREGARPCARAGPAPAAHQAQRGHGKHAATWGDPQALARSHNPLPAEGTPQDTRSHTWCQPRWRQPSTQWAEGQEHPSHGPACP